MTDNTSWFIFCGLILLALAALFILYSCMMESANRQRTIEAAIRWAENKNRRSLRAESRELWDSVNNLKRGINAMPPDMIDKLPAFQRRNEYLDYQQRNILQD